MRILTHPPSRHAFLGLWGGWTVVAVLAAAVYGWDDEAGPILAAGVLVLACGVAVILELPFRSRRLPVQAGRPWHAMLVVPLLVIPLLVIVAGHRFEHYLPGVTTWTYRSDLAIPPQRAGDADVDLVLTFVATKSNWGASLRTLSFSETRVWLLDQDENAWVLDRRLRNAQPVGRPEQSVALNDAGYEELMSGLIADSAPPGDIKRSAKVLREFLSSRSSPGGPSVSVPNTMVSRGLEGIERPLQWHWIAAALFSFLLIPITALVVGATMYPRVGRE